MKVKSLYCVHGNMGGRQIIASDLTQFDRPVSVLSVTEIEYAACFKFLRLQNDYLEYEK